jgi:arabinofuranan 3-O-arabinosyltransferase
VLALQLPWLVAALAHPGLATAAAGSARSGVTAFAVRAETPAGRLVDAAGLAGLPMGPIYAAGHAIGLPAWVVQRIWWSIVLLTAFHGVHLLCRRLELGTPGTRVIAALAYSLSPRMLTEIGPVSVEAWPMAVAPWALVPLVRVRPGGQVTAAARSGIAIALAGGVNAVAAGTVLPLPAWWLITRRGGPLRRSLARWWLLAVAFAIAWWLAPLIILGRYSPPFLDWIESAVATTSHASLPSAWRGTTQWVAWFRLPDPIWPAGWEVISSPVIAALTWILIGIAVVALLRRDMPYRLFLAGGVIGGLALLTFGYVGALTPP